MSLTQILITTLSKSIVLLGTMLLLVVISTSSCTPKTSSKTTSTNPAPVHQSEKELTSKSDTFPVTDAVLVEPEEVVPIPYLSLRMERTSCFGQCPTYEIKLFSDGRAQWNGKHYIKRLGIYEAQVGEAFFDKILTKASQINYFSLSEHYPVNGKYLSDLPNTILYLNDSQQEKSILRNHNGPKTLREFEDFIFESFDKLNWEKLASD